MAYIATNPYLSLAELAEELKAPIPDPATDDDPEKAQAELDKWHRAIERASRFVDDWLGEDFFFHDFSTVPLILDQFSKGVYGEKIFLPYKPVIGITRIDYGTELYVADTDYVVDPAGIVYGTRGSWSPSRPDGLIKIYGTFGYQQDDPESVPTGLPSKVKIASRIMAAVWTGDLKKEFQPLDGDPISIVQSEIPKTVFTVLGKRMPILT
jgi:hypothetical protein